MEELEVPFLDGNVTGAVRVGMTVRRRTDAWTAATHPLLRHLERAGFEAAPRVLGFDEQGREMLSYIPGATDPDPWVHFGSDDALAEVARMLRRYHDATLDFVSPPDALWQFQPGAPASSEVICHNDVAPWNTVVDEGQAITFIDWDFAAPGPRSWDIAHAVWRFAPLYESTESSAGPPHASVLRRLRPRGAPRARSLDPSAAAGDV